MTGSTQKTFNKRRWMTTALDINVLALTDIVWPGAHNCGMDKKAPNYDVVIGNWTTCQNDTFAWQLDNGARAFDIRLGYTEGHDQSIFYFHHNGFQSHRLLDELIDAVTNFLDQNPDEFIIFDFHQLGDGDKTFDHHKLNNLLMQRLRHRMIPLCDSTKTVGELKRLSNRRRLIVSTPFLLGLDQDYYWPGIPHKWSGEVFTDTEELERHISSTVSRAPQPSYLWSLSATSYGFLGGPQDIKHKINDWFNSSGKWVTRCSIINTDFFDESHIVRYCWSATSMKAVYGDALHRPADA